MTEPKKPEPGEYWGCWNRPAVRIIGFDGLECVVRHKDGRLTTLATGNWQKTDSDWKYLPWCKSFDDTEPVAEGWPKYFVGNKWGHVDAFVRYDRPDFIGVWVRSDGSETQDHSWYYHDAKREADRVSWREITESEALARLTPKCHDCGELAGDGHADVCPMAWVVQDRVPDRIEIDQWRRVHDEWIEHTWQESKICDYYEDEQHYMHGHVNKKNGSRFEVRCRRKDLPPLPDTKPPELPVTRETVHQWIAEWMAGKHFTLSSSP